jgi:hypothetical protein
MENIKINIPKYKGMQTIGPKRPRNKKKSYSDEFKNLLEWVRELCKDGCVCYAKDHTLYYPDLECSCCVRPDTLSMCKKTIDGKIYWKLLAEGKYYYTDPVCKCVARMDLSNDKYTIYKDYEPITRTIRGVNELHKLVKPFISYFEISSSEQM